MNWRNPELLEPRGAHWHRVVFSLLAFSEAWRFSIILLKKRVLATNQRHKSIHGILRFF